VESCSIGSGRWHKDSYCWRWLGCGGGRWLERIERLLYRDYRFSSGKVFKQSRGNKFLVHVDYMLELSKDRLLELGMGIL
jgi:hypothetical protein